jgi:hypothetical protein
MEGRKSKKRKKFEVYERNEKKLLNAVFFGGSGHTNNEAPLVHKNGIEDNQLVERERV